MGGGDLSPEAKKLKLTKSKWELIKLKNISKEIIKKGGGGEQPMEWKKIFANDMNELISK